MPEPAFYPHEDPCRRGGRHEMIQRTKLVDDDAMGQAFHGPAERITVWECRKCGWRDDSFTPSPEGERTGG